MGCGIPGQLALPSRVGRLVYAELGESIWSGAQHDEVDEDSPTLPLHESGRATLDAEDLLRGRLRKGRDTGPVVILHFARAS